MKYSTPNTKASHIKIKCRIWKLYGPVCTYNTCVTDNIQFISRQLFDKQKLECVYLAERDTSLTPLYGDDTAVLCSFKLSSM